MPDNSISVTEARRSGVRLVGAGIAAIVLILVTAAIFLFWTLPDANAFNARVERLFIESDLTSQTEIRLLEILAQSGTAFADTLSSYRMVIFVLLVFASAMLVTALVFLVMLVLLNRRMAQIERTGIQVTLAADQPRGKHRLPEQHGFQTDPGGDGNPFGAGRIPSG